MKLNWVAVTYNASMATGVMLVGMGSGFRWGWPIGLIVTGAALIALTAFAMTLLRPRQ